MSKSARLVRNVTIPLPIPLHQRLRKAAAEHDESMTSYVVHALEGLIPVEPGEQSRGRALVALADREVKRQRLSGTARNLTDEELYGTSR